MTAKTVNKRWWFWLPLLGSAAWLAVFGDKTPANTVALPAPPRVSPQSLGGKSATPATSGFEKTVSPGKSRSDAAQSSKSLEALVPRDRLIPSPQAGPLQARDLFASGDWTPPPPVVKPLPPPPPMAPALPFTFLGKKLEGKVWEVFLARGEQSFIVREGTVLDNTYRIETISPPTLNLTYLPLGQSQSLLIGDSQ
jgi:hypothetical protein